MDLSNKLPGGGFMSRPRDLVRLGSAWLAVYPEQSLVIALSINTTLAEFARFSQVQTALVALFAEEQRPQTGESAMQSPENVSAETCLGWQGQLRWQS